MVQVSNSQPTVLCYFQAVCCQFQSSFLWTPRKGSQHTGKLFPETLHTKGYLLTALISEGSLDGCSVVDLWILSLSFLKMLVCVRVDQAGLKLRRSVSPVRGYGVHYQAWLCLCVLCQSLLYVVFKHHVLSFHLLDYLYLVLLLNDNLARYNALARQSILALRYFIPVTLLRSQLLILLSS